MFNIYFTPTAKRALAELKANRSFKKRYSAVTKAIEFLQNNPRHSSLQTYEYRSFKGPKGEKIFEAYAEQKTPAAYRVFFYYGPNKGDITIFAITPHP